MSSWASISSSFDGCTAPRMPQPSTCSPSGMREERHLRGRGPRRPEQHVAAGAERSRRQVREHGLDVLLRAFSHGSVVSIQGCGFSQ